MGLEQVTTLKCGGHVLGFGMSHQVWDGYGVVEFLFNLMSLAQGGPLMFQPKPDRVLFKARDPPTPVYDHPEYLKLDELPSASAAAETNSAFTATEAVKSEFVETNASTKHLSKVWHPLYCTSELSYIARTWFMELTFLFQGTAVEWIAVDHFREFTEPLSLIFYRSCILARRIWPH